MNVILDFDDFSPRNTNFGIFEEIREHYPDFKVTLFTVPWETRFSTQTPITEFINTTSGKERKWKAFIEAVQTSDWIEIALHGLTHVPEEFLNLTHDDAKKRIMIGEKMLINTGIPYTKLFKAPFWQLSQGGKKAAEELGFKVAEDHYYNWNLKDDLSDLQLLSERKINNESFVIGHGHIQQTSGNGLEEVLHRIYRLPTDTKFHFLSEYFQSEKVDPRTIDFRDPLEKVSLIDKDSGKEIT